MKYFVIEFIHVLYILSIIIFLILLSIVLWSETISAKTKKIFKFLDTCFMATCFSGNICNIRHYKQTVVVRFGPWRWSTWDEVIRNFDYIGHEEITRCEYVFNWTQSAGHSTITLFYFYIVYLFIQFLVEFYRIFPEILNSNITR